MNKRRIGGEREQQAGQYLSACGYDILEYNFRSRTGEVDIVAMDGDVLVFVEVKYRSSAGAGSPEEAVGADKIRRICRTADYYRMTHHRELGLSADSSCRFDVVAILGNQIRLIRNAFDYVPAGRFVRRI